MTTPIERAAEACLTYSASAYGDSGWKWDELSPETRDIWVGYARAAFESIDRDELARIILGFDFAELKFPDRRDELDRDSAYRKADAIIAHLTGKEQP